jgi:ElaB/YqjD/DUF883 family membrane-anchored ribosome-binding protein
MNPNPVPNPLRVEEAGANVDKIRDILFGSQMRDYDSRFRRLEESLQRETAEIRELTRARLDALEQHFKKELETLTTRLKTERDDRHQSVDQLTRDLRDLHQNLSRRLTELADESAENNRQLREDLLQRSKSLLDEIQTRHVEAAQTVERSLDDVRKNKADRSAIASLLTEVALRLNEDFHLPQPTDPGQ